jgi:hypothetical protein
VGEKSNNLFVRGWTGMWSAFTAISVLAVDTSKSDGGSLDLGTSSNKTDKAVKISLTAADLKGVKSHHDVVSVSETTDSSNMCWPLLELCFDTKDAEATKFYCDSTSSKSQPKSLDKPIPLWKKNGNIVSNDVGDILEQILNDCSEKLKTKLHDENSRVGEQELFHAINKSVGGPDKLELSLWDVEISCEKASQPSIDKELTCKTSIGIFTFTLFASTEKGKSNLITLKNVGQEEVKKYKFILKEFTEEDAFSINENDLEKACEKNIELLFNAVGKKSLLDPASNTHA